NAVACDPPTSFVVVAVDGAWNMAAAIGLAAAAIDDRADVEDDQAGIAEMGLEPGGGRERRRIICRGGGDDREDEAYGACDAVESSTQLLEWAHDPRAAEAGH